MTNVIAKQYAQALFSLAQEQQQLDNMYQDLQLLLKQMDSEASFYLFMKHPNITKNDKKQVLETVWKDQVQPYVLNLLKLLVDKHRFSYIKEIIQCFFTLYREEKNIIVANVMSAKALSDEELSSIVKMLEKKFSKEIELKYHIQQDLLAGVKIVVNGDVMDNTLQRRLQNLRKALHTNSK